MTRLLARWRVTLGFAFAVLVLYLATPTPWSLAIGATVAVAGELVRLWAAGHLEKSKEVTQSGPYRYTRHPLYLGSSLIGIGMAIGSHHLVVASIVVAYLVLTLTAAMRSEAKAAGGLRLNATPARPAAPKSSHPTPGPRR